MNDRQQARIARIRTDVRPVCGVLDCGGKRRAPPLWPDARGADGPASTHVPKRRRRCALPARSKTWRRFGARDLSRFTAGANIAPQRNPALLPLPNRSGLKSALLALLLLSTLLPQLSTCIAQSFAIDWHTLDGGGGTSTGGRFSLAGTIGQPDAGTLSGGGFVLVGGFPGFHVVPAGPVTLTIQLLANGRVQVSWPADGEGWRLQAATRLGTRADWSTITDPGVTSYTAPAAGPARYFRLRRP
jgi:hypothetical protein